jgi:hypothetical protein
MAGVDLAYATDSGSADKDFSDNAAKLQELVTLAGGPSEITYATSLAALNTTRAGNIAAAEADFQSTQASRTGRVARATN